MPRVAAPLSALRTVLGNPDQRRIQLAWGGCITAEGAGLVALGVYAFGAGGVVAVGLLGVVRTLPAAVLGPFAAALADRWPRPLVLAWVLRARAAALAGVAVLVVVESPAAVIYALAAADALAFSLYWPAHSALQPELARTPDQLTAANAATTTLENLGTLLGPAVSAVLLAVASLPWLFVAAAALVLPATVAVRRVAAAPRPHSAASRLTAGDLVAGFATLAREPAPRLVAGVYLAQTLCLGAVPVFVVVAAIELLGIGEPGVGTLQAAIGAGGLAGSVGALALVGSGRLAATLAGAAALWGICLAVIGVLPVPVAALLALGGVGVCNALVDVSALTLLQRLVPARVLARALGAFEGLWWAMLGLGALVASLLVQLLGIRGGLVALGAVLPLLAAAGARALARVDASVAVPARELALLGGLPMLAPLPSPTLEGLALACEPVAVPDGGVIITAGEVGDRFYVVDHGAVEVATATGPVRLGPGEGFGEIALLRDVPRTSTVTARGDTRLFALERHDFLLAVTGHPSAARAADAVIEQRLGGGPA